MKKIAIFASGSGSNFQAIVNVVKEGGLKANVALLICDKPGAKVIERATNAGIPVFVFNPKEFDGKVAFESAILQELEAKEVDFVVLAGYMRLIGDTLLRAYGGRISNIHPSLLPSFPGKDAMGQAFAAGVKVTGVTIHYVDEGMDTGPIIAQQAVNLADDETLESLQQKVHDIEHSLYIKTLQNIL